jgi:hypothetical protein
MLVLTLSMIFVNVALADDDYIIAKFIYMFDGKNIIGISQDIVISTSNFYILHNEGIIFVNYTSSNGTSILKNKPYQSGIISFPMYDESLFTVTDTEGNVLISARLHVLNVQNFFAYIFPMKYQQIAISILFAFLMSLLVVFVLYISREQWILR